MADTNWADYWSGLGKTQDYYNGGGGDDPGVDGSGTGAGVPAPVPTATTTTPSSAFSTGDWTDQMNRASGTPSASNGNNFSGPGQTRTLLGGGSSGSSLSGATGDLGTGTPGTTTPTTTRTGRGAGLLSGSVGNPAPVAGYTATENRGGYTETLNRPGGFTGARPVPTGAIQPGPDTAPPGGINLSSWFAGNTVAPPTTPPATPPTLTGNNQYWNSYTNQWQQTPPVNPAGSGLATNNSGFLPTFLSGNQVTGPGANGTGQATGAQNLNPMYYATKDTADFVAKQLGPGYSVVMNTDGYAQGLQAPGSPFSFPGAYMIRFPDGHLENAGQLAQPWSNGSFNSSTLDQMRNGGATLAQQQAQMPISPSVRASDYQQVGGPGNPITYTPAARTQQDGWAAANTPPPTPPPTPTPTPAPTPEYVTKPYRDDGTGGLDPNLLAFLNLFSKTSGSGGGNQLLDFLRSLTGSSQGNNSNDLSAIFDQLMGQSDLYQRRRQYPQFA